MSHRSLGMIIPAFLLTISLALTSQLAHAGPADDIAKTIRETTQAQIQSDKGLFEELKKQITEAENSRQDAQIKEEARLYNLQIEDSIDYDLLGALQSIPTSVVLSSLYTSTAMDSRYRELNHIKMTTGSGDLADGIVDSTSGSLANDPANFRIYMDYFCDPASAAGLMSKIGNAAAIAANAMFKLVDRKTNYQFSCGKKRIEVLGAPTSSEMAKATNAQIIGLPLKPQALYFEPLTFPATPTGGTTATTNASNTNKLASLVYGAHQYFIRLAFGKPADITSVADISGSGGPEAYVKAQGRIARHMLAAYPFALLYGERMGTMGSDAAKEVGTLLRTNWSDSASDSAILTMIENLEKQKTISLAQYMDVVMYKVPMSSGYISRIQSLTPQQLQREKLLLMSYQSVLRYNINRWMEISTAIEAVQ